MFYTSYIKSSREIQDLKYNIELLKCKSSCEDYQRIRDRHYVPNHGAVGQQLHYLIFLDGEIVGIISAGSAVYSVKCRDEFFGITSCNRVVSLNGIIDNTVFRLEKNLPNLGTQILKAWRNRVCDDWKRKYGVDVAGFETFIIENDRRKGALYKADNWVFVGETAGSAKAHDKGIKNKQFRVETEKKLVFCKRIEGVALPTAYFPTWRNPNMAKGQISMFD